MNREWHSKILVGIKALACVAAVTALFGFNGFGEIIPPERRVEWIPGSTVGVKGGIPTTRTEWTNLVSAGADPTGNTSCSARLQNLLNTCPPNRYVYVPPGRYRLGTQVALNGTRSQWTLRGAGKTNTVFVPAASAFVLDNWNYTTVQIPGGLAKGQSNFTVSADVSASVGKNCMISSKNAGRTNVHVIGVDAGDRLLKQISQVVAVSGNNVTVWPPLYFDHPAELAPTFQYQAGPQTEGIGFEDFTIDSSTAASANCISWFGTRNSWFKNLRIRDPNGFHFNLGGNLFTEIRDSDFVSTRAGANTAVILMGGDCGDLVENNFSIGGSPFVECNNSSGNVIAYNYVTNAVSNDFHVGNPFDNHNPHSMMNLWEGNHGTMYQSDSYFGSSSHNTLFRNVFNGYDPIKVGIPRCIDLGRWSTYWNLVGNVLGDPRSASLTYMTTNQYYNQTLPVIYRFGFPFPGNTSYGYSTANAIQTPATDWRYPGSNRLGGVITGPTANTTTLSGNFSRVQAGDLLVIQSASNTNFYYPLHESWPRLIAAGNGTASSLAVNKSIWATNGDSVFRIGPDAFPQLQFDDIRTHLIHGNYDYANRDTIWDTAIADHTLPPSLFRTSMPVWWPAGLAWPPAGSDVSGLSVPLPAKTRYYSGGTSVSGAPGIPGGLRKISP